MIITIGRQHGSNGHDIARKLSEKLGIPCYDKEIVDEAARGSDINKDVVESFDEKKVGPVFSSAPQFAGFGASFNLNSKIAASQFDAIKALAEKGDCIFVGRCADYVLRNRSDLIKVFICADYAFRVRTIMERKDLSEDKAKKLIKEVDKDRSSYYRYYTDRNWGDMENYELCLDSSRTGVDGAVEVIAALIKNINADNAVF